jgi:hypothetical protein
MGCILEFAKCFFFYQSIASTHLNIGVRVTMFSITIILFCTSIIASIGFVYNQNNETKNRTIKTSSQVKEQQSAKQVQQDLYNQKKNELATLQREKDNQVGDKALIRDSMPRNYIDRKNTINNEINKITSSMQDKINAKSAELSSIGLQLQAPIDTSKINVNATKGYTAFLKVICDKLNKSEDAQEEPWTIEQLEVILFSCLSITFELVAIFLMYIAQHSVHQTKSNIESSNNIFSVNKPVILAKTQTTANQDNNQRIIGFKPPSTHNKVHGIDSDMLSRYVNYMHAHQKDNISPGYRTIGNAIAIDIESARKIKGHLEQTGVITTVGNRTIIV